MRRSKKNAMKVLVVTTAFPYPPIDGDVLPIYHFLRCLAPRVDYTLLTLPPANPAYREEGCRVLSQWGMRVEVVSRVDRSRLACAWHCLRGGRPWLNKFFSPELARWAAELLAGEHFDAVHSESILSAQHLPRQLDVGSVLIARDCLSLRHWRRWRLSHNPYEALQWLKIGWMERSLYRRADRIMAISPIDRDAMARLSGGRPVDLLPNGTDTEAFRPNPDREQPDTVVFFGAMDYPPNVDGAVFFATKVWPRIRRERPGARLLLVGRDPVDSIRALAADPSIEVTGMVERMQDWIARATVVVSPLRFGTGMKNKVLEAAAMGKAMVVTDVSLEAIDLEVGRDLVQAETVDEMAREVLSLMNDPQRRAQLGASARRTVVARYAWETMSERLWKSYEDLASNRNAE